MKNSIIDQKKEYEQKRRKQKRWKSVVTALACVVVFCTTYALILPAITMENTAYCGYEEHVHNDECYQVALICETTEELQEISHEHESECYEKERLLICNLEEISGHTHEDGCKIIETSLTCGLEETEIPVEVVTEDISEEVVESESETEEIVEVHQHTENCYTEIVTDLCGLDEILGHSHEDGCYEMTEHLVCDLTTQMISKEHIHTESCYENRFVCEKEEHAHVKSCYSNPAADVETAEQWEATLPNVLTGNSREDLIAVAVSQLGYRESRENYVVTEDGDVKGYTRYGDWYGSSYGDWCAMYISFCLHYAEITEDVMPREAGCQKWIELLSSEVYQLYRTAEEYEPIPGDLIFFNNDIEEDSDHVGIVTSILEATEDMPAKIEVIEGNTSDEVAYRTYELTDSTIMGYGVFPTVSEDVLEEPMEVEETPTRLSMRNVSDEYAPEDVVLTGVWAEDVIAIANSQVGYSEVYSLSKYDQWSGNNGTYHWNVNFVNYCLHYAGVNPDAIPWNTSYDFGQWVSALEGAGLYKTYNADSMKPGDIVFVQGWNAGQNYNVGVCVESSGGAFYIVFGDMDVNGQVIKEQFWSNWTGRLLGYISLSDYLQTSIAGKLTASVGYNGGVLPQGTELFVELIEESDSYLNLIETNLQPAGSQVREDYYLDIRFMKDGQEIYPKSSLNISIDFSTPLNSGKTEGVSSGKVQWIHGLIYEGTIGEAMSLIQTEKDSNDCITKANVSYEPNAIYALAAMQEMNLTLQTETLMGETKVVATAVGNASAISENMQMEINFIDENTEAWILKIDEIYKSEKEMVSSNVFFEVIFKDAYGNRITLPDDAKISIILQFAPPVSSSLPDGSNARSGNWKLNGVETVNEIVALEEINAKFTIAKNVSMESVTFDYSEKQAYALSAVVIDPAYTDTVYSYEELSRILESGASIIQIKLGEDIWIPSSGGFTIGSGKKVFLDLNGHDITVNGTLFNIKAGAEVSIIDGEAVAESTDIVAEMHLRADEDGDSTAQLAANKSNVGVMASYDAWSEKLIYYVIETEITDHSVGATKETLVKHTAVLKGNIKGGNEAVIKVEGGKFQLDSGAITGCTNTAILQTGGALELNGGYICNNHRASGNGGAIYSTGDSNILVDGTVIAGNSSAENGGAIYIDGKEFVLNSGVISGNSAEISGGGVFGTGATKIELNGGYITNNRAESTEYRGGGGGVFTNEEAAVYLNSGYITGNYAESGGGGIRTFASKFQMDGGFINSNYANLSEGGGLSVNEYGTGEILGGYINNNVSNTHQHWGGGGIFSANDSTLFIKRILVTNNDAGGYGGGVAGCSTGRAFIYQEDGGAIYDNTAVDRNSSNPHVSGGESTKAEDHIYPTSTFRQNGYEDYFCAFNSIISGTLLGGGSANWSGTIDGLPVTIARTEEASSTYLMGLVSDPSDSDLRKAQENARVYVNGNDSYTHGGGVLGNGYLIIGTTDSVEVYARLKIDATKEMTGAELEDGQFDFIIEDLHTGFRVATGTNDREGKVTFDHLLPFTEAGTYEYLIYEDHTSENGEYVGILMDTTEYKVAVTVEKIVEWLPKSIKKEKYIITSIVIEKRNGGEWELVQHIGEPENSDIKPVTLTLTKGSSFHNLVTEYTTFSVVKRWVGNIEENAVQIQLLRDGTAFGNPIELSAANHWTYVWENELPLYHWVNGEKVFYTYSVEELNVPDDYEVTYDYFNTTESDAVWIPYTGTVLELEKDYIIVAPDGQHVLYVSNVGGDHTITETDKASVIKQTKPITVNGQRYTDYFYDGTVLPGSIYRAQNTDGIRLNLPAAGYRAIAVPSDGYGYNLQSSWWPLRNLYVGNTQVCTTGVDDWNNYMIVYENGKFDAVSYNPWNQNAAKLYTLAYSDLSNETIFTVTNTKVEDDVLYKLDITKVSAENTAVLLAGAEFTLYPAKENGEPDLEYPAIFAKTAAGAYNYLGVLHNRSVTSAEITTMETARGGKLVISGLPKGHYVLVETKAPNGYLIAEPIQIHLGEETEMSTTYRITVKDEVEGKESYVLPETGGSGRTKDRMLGIALIGMALVLHIYRKKLNFRGKHT